MDALDYKRCLPDGVPTQQSGFNACRGPDLLLQSVSVPVFILMCVCVCVCVCVSVAAHHQSMTRIES